MTRYGMALSAFALWLTAWIVLSWAAIQDDALIHLRYAENLVAHHAITYDGVHPNFGTSSLLYVGLLAAASTVTRSPNLPRLVSSVAHAALFGGLAWIFLRRLERTSRLASLLSLILLALLISPSSIRWLDDGMETGIVLCGTASLACFAWEQSRRTTVTTGEFAGMALIGFLLVLLRTELAMLAGIAAAAMFAGRLEAGGEGGCDRSVRGVVQAAIRSSHLVLGCLLGSAAIVVTMGVLLPDTALAKAEGMGAWRLVLVATRVVMTSSLSVGAGLAIFWLLTLTLVVVRRRLDAATAVANLVFPVLVGLSMLRGQDIQGVRYLLWALLFPSVWNVLSLGRGRAGVAREVRAGNRSSELAPVYAFALLFLLELPFEAKLMYHVLTTRARTMRAFEGQHLEQLAGLEGVSMDIGYIGYFTHARICDMSGLVNGRAVARMGTLARVKRCADQNPGFAFGNSDQLDVLARYLPMSSWRVCGEYSFGNLRSPDTHFLVAPPAVADGICRAAGRASATISGTTPIDGLLHRTDLRSPEAPGAR